MKNSTSPEESSVIEFIRKHYATIDYLFFIGIGMAFGSIVFGVWR